MRPWLQIMAEGLKQVLVLGSVKWGRRLLKKEKHIIEQKDLDGLE